MFLSFLYFDYSSLSHAVGIMHIVVRNRERCKDFLTTDAKALEGLLHARV